MSDIVGDMTTFTARELHRETARVLAAAEREGETVIVRRDGKSFSLSLREQHKRTRGKREFPDFLARMRRQGMPKIGRKVSEAVDRAIAGE